ncbi:MAG: hypothetical protein HY423_08850 [Candidatus Lambdaproteobacteria bacterium]|nr:hypothetical protein [Candidatus Lambdaproteobacteria bacterium]
MAQQAQPGRGFPLAGLLARALRPRSPWGWAPLLALALPWLRLPLGPAVLYPGHLLLAALLAIALAGSRGARAPAAPPLRAALPLLTYLLVTMLLRRQWAPAALWAGAGTANYAWGWAAHRLGRSGAAGPAQDGLILLLGATLAAGVALWLGAWLWSPLCTVLNCRAHDATLFLFEGGFNAPQQFLVMAILLLPVVGVPLVVLNRSGRGGPAGRVLLALAAATGLALLTGARLWYLALFAAGWWGVAQLLDTRRHSPDRLLLKGSAVFYAYAAVVLYGLVPGYQGYLLARNLEEGRSLRVLAQPPPQGMLSSLLATPFAVRVANPGPFTLEATPARPAWLFARVLIQPERSEAVTAIIARAPLTEVLVAGGAVELDLPLRLPPWADEGFLVWGVEAPSGTDLRLTDDSSLGFRFRNSHFRDLTQEPENVLSALAERSRDLLRSSEATATARGRLLRRDSALGDVLDTLVFSPLWGQRVDPARKAGPFLYQGSGAGRSFWAQLLHEYGLLGVLLAGWWGWRIAAQAAALGRAAPNAAGRLGWALAALSVFLLAFAGLFTPELGSYHGEWGLILLSGFTEGRHDQVFGARTRRALLPQWNRVLVAMAQWMRRPARRRPHRTHR